MNIRKILFFLPFLFTSSLFAVSSGRWVDGIIEFAKYDVGGVPAFSDTERDYILTQQPGSQVTAVVPAPYEVNLSTCLLVIIDGKIEITFDSFSDFLSCQTKAGLKRKVRKIRQLIDSMSDLPAADSKDFKERAGWLKSYYQSLP